MRRPLLHVVISVALNLKIDAITAFHTAAPQPDRRQSRTQHPFDNHHTLIRKYPTTLCASIGGDSGNDEHEQKQQDDDDIEAGVEVGFSALPPIGASSFWARSFPKCTNSTESISLVSSKFRIQYTCKICSTRNSHSVTRLAYRKGVVIAMCKGCFCRHLLADNLGWSNYAGGFNFDDGETNIEIYMENRARENGERTQSDDNIRENNVVLRVNQEVFDLEQILYKGQGKVMLSSDELECVDQLGEDGNEMEWN